MSIKTITISIMATGVLASGVHFLNQENTPVYQPKKNTQFEHAAGRYEYAIEYTKLLKADQNGVISQKEVSKARQNLKGALASKADGMGLVWQSMGPNNIGGRTRAIVIDRNNPNYLLAGSVTGGLYVSFDAAQTWHERFGGTNLLISALAQTANGYYYIGTGALHDGSPSGTSNSSDNTLGNGMYRLKNLDSDYEHVADADVLGDAWTGINQIIAHPTNPDKLFVGSKGGLQVSDNASAAAPTFTLHPDIGSGTVDDIDISPDGNTVLVSQVGRIYRSTDGGSNFALAINLQSSRAEVAMSSTDNNYAYATSVNGNGCLQEIVQSTDGGDTWQVIATGSGGNTATFDPFANPGVNCQGNYDNAIAIFPNDPGKILIGGVQLWMGQQQAGSSPPLFGWTQVAVTTGGPQSLAGAYVHADKHRILIPTANTIYIGSDGGVGKSIDGGVTWTQNNRGYHTAQFYSLGIVPQVTPPDLVMGGTQDNGSPIIGIPFATNDPSDAIEISGGDGFACDISAFGNIIFSTSQNGSVLRTSGQTQQPDIFWDNELQAACGGGNDCAPFYTPIRFWESYNPEAITFDSVTMVSDDNLNAGDTVTYQSIIGGVPLSGILSNPINAGDTFYMPDYLQSKFAFGISAGNAIYLTRDAASISVETDWSRVADDASFPDPLTAPAFYMQFSDDGNHLFVATTNSRLYRISNLLYAYDSLTTDIRSSSSVVTCTQIASFPTQITGFAIDPNEPNNMIVTTGRYSNDAKVWRITNAEDAGSGGANETSIQGDLPQGMPVYDAEIDVENNNIVLIGTDFGIWATRNAFSGSGASVEWADENNGIPRMPAYRIKQQQNEFAYNLLTTSENFEPASNYKSYYVATHGSGFYKTESLVGIKEIGGNNTKFKTNLSVYPNPVRLNSYLEFKLQEKAQTTVLVYDLKGQLVSQQDLGSLTAGKQKIKLETSSLAVGTYIVTLKSGKQTDVTKFIKTE
jgi:hypothetical protein